MMSRLKKSRLFNACTGVIVEMATYLQRKRKLPVRNEEVAYEGELPAGLRLIIGAKSGLLLYIDGQLNRVLDQHVYGITYHGGRWYAFTKVPVTIFGRTVKRSGQIVSFVVTETSIDDLRVEASMMDQEVHQIEAFGDHLYVTDTAFNRVIRYEIGPEGLRDRLHIYPAGRLENGRSSPNYVHVNSVFCTSDNVFLFYHMDSVKTGRLSEVAELNPQFQTVRRTIVSARCGHNIIPVPEGWLYCDSLGGRLMLGEQAIFEAPYFLRGIAVTDNMYLLGGADFATRDERNWSRGFVFAFDRDTHESVGELRISSGGSIYEIRAIDPVDYGLSSNSVYETSVATVEV